MVYIIFSGLGVILILILFYQHKIFQTLKKNNIDFLRNLTDGNIDKGLRGNPFKVIPYVLKTHEIDNTKIRAYKMRIRLLLLLIPIAVLIIAIYIELVNG